MLLAIVAMLVALVSTQFQLARARAKLNILANRFGVLQVTDETKFHVIASDTSEPHVYKWQVHLPPGRRYYLFAAHGLMSPTRLPPTRSEASRIAGTEVHPAETRDGILVTFSIKLVGEKWVTSLSGDSSGSSGRQYPIETFSWLNKSSEGHRTGKAGSLGTQQYSVDEPLILLFHRQDVVTNLKPGQPEPSTDGLVVWIQEFFGSAPDGSLIFEKPSSIEDAP